MQDSDLMPCPFCSSTDVSCEEDAHGPTHFVLCDNCKSQGPIAADAETARQLWNRRVQKQSTAWLELAESRRGK